MRKGLAIGIGLLLIGGTVWAQQYLVTTIAGGGLPPTAATASSTALGTTLSVATDAAGSAYFIASNCVFKVDVSGVLTRVAGNSARWGRSGDGGPATSAQLSHPSGVAVDGSGNLYIADTYNNVIRKVAAASGNIATVAGNGTDGYSGDGGLATSAQLSFPAAVAVDASGNIYIADSYERIRKVNAATGIITTVAGNGASGYSGDGGPATSAQLSGPTGVAVDAAGDIYIADYWNQRIRKVTAATGVITTAAGNGTEGYSGDGGQAATAELNYPWGVSVDAAGNLYISDQYNGRIRKVAAATGIIATVAGGGSASPGDGGQATSASLNTPLGAAVDGSGNLYIADNGNCRIRRVAAATGIITTAAGNGTNYSGDGNPATSAQLWMPFGMAVDGSGNLYIPDLYNRRVRKVSAATGVVTTVAGNGSYGYSGDGGPATSAKLSAVYSVAVDASGNLYIGDNDSQRVRKVTPNGVITTVAGFGTQGYWGDGGPATSALLNDPDGVAVDSAGSIYIVDGNQTVRKVAANGTIATIAGTGYWGYQGDGGPAASALFDGPERLAVDAAGNVYVADTYNNVIRLLAPEGTSALLSIASTHSANFAPGQTAATYSAVVSNAAAAGPTVGAVTATEILPAGLTLVSMSGAGWSCAGAICTRNDALNPGAGYPPIAVTVNVAGNAPSQVLNQVAVSGGGAWPTSSSDLTTVFSELLVSSGGVVNAASYTAPVAPGSLAAAFGNFLLTSPIPVTAFPIPTNLGGLSLQFASAPLAPLFFGSSGQVNVQIPWELAGQSQPTVIAGMNGLTSAPQTASLATYAPGIFTANGAGSGPGAIRDANYQPVSASNPTTAGAFIQIYCTGLGPVSNQPATGAPSPLNPLASTPTWPIVTIGGVSAPVQFSGLTPGDVGLYQVNAQVPTAAPKGAAVPLSISIGGATSNTVTIAVQ